MSKYDPLGSHLSANPMSSVPMTFAEIERVLGFPLPPKAKAIRAWWSNNADNSSMTRVWLDAGFRSEQVDMAGEKLVFRRVKPAEPSGFQEAQAPLKGAGGRHPLIGWMKGTFTIAPGTDLTQPADPEWADLIEDPDWGKLPE